MNWMSIFFTAEAVLYCICLVFLALAIREEWQKECQDFPTPIFFELLFAGMFSFVCLIIDAAAAYLVNGEWQTISWTGLLIGLAWLSILGLAFFVYTIISFYIDEARFKKAEKAKA